MNEVLRGVCAALRKGRAVRRALHIRTSRIPIVKVLSTSVWGPRRPSPPAATLLKHHAMERFPLAAADASCGT